MRQGGDTICETLSKNIKKNNCKKMNFETILPLCIVCLQCYLNLVWGQIVPDSSKMGIPLKYNNISFVTAVKFPATSHSLTPTAPSLIQSNVLELLPSGSMLGQGYAEYAPCLTQNIAKFRIEIDIDVTFGGDCPSFAFFISNAPVTIRNFFVNSSYSFLLFQFFSPNFRWKRFS